MANSDTEMNKSQAIDPEHFLAYCKELKGKTLFTYSRKAPFRVEVKNGIPAFMPLSPRSKGVLRSHGKWQRVLELFAERGSYRSSDYKDTKSVNLSYMPAVVKSYVEHLPTCHHPEFSNTAVAKLGMDNANNMDKEIERIEKSDAWDEGDEVVQVEVKKPLAMVIPVRLSSEKWE